MEVNKIHQEITNPYILDTCQLQRTTLDDLIHGSGKKATENWAMEVIALGKLGNRKMWHRKNTTSM